jgi:MoaA/NifB/PqqE/SkfB family radical SAM enzyme
MSTKKLERFAGDSTLMDRFYRLMKFSSTRRTMLVHITNKCNLRCRGCWFYEDGFDKNIREVTELEKWYVFAKSEANRGINTAVLIGGEPTLYPERIAAVRQHIPCITVSTNGEIPLSSIDFPDATVALTMFRGGEIDDRIRAIRPNNRVFTSLFDKVLNNYRNDRRAGFVYGLASSAIEHIRPTVQKIGDAGLRVTFNFYRDYTKHTLETADQERRLITRRFLSLKTFPIQ